MFGYNGMFGIDINPETQPVEAALARNFNAITLANGVVDNLDHAAVIDVYHRPNVDRGRIEDQMTFARAKG